uniref:Uncharacterized protein n=1 Tax=Anguilla anguilla TaxID=7936 RepID=A0A0E9U5J3_ANGAN
MIFSIVPVHPGSFSPR